MLAVPTTNTTINFIPLHKILRGSKVAEGTKLHIYIVSTSSNHCFLKRSMCPKEREKKKQIQAKNANHLMNHNPSLRDQQRLSL